MLLFIGCTPGYDVPVTSFAILLFPQSFLTISVWQPNTSVGKCNNKS